MSNPVLYDQVMSVLPGALREWLDGESVPVSVAVVLRSSLLNQHLELFLTSGERWPHAVGQIFRVLKWSVCRWRVIHEAARHGG
jgi:hypothetical protein